MATRGSLVLVKALENPHETEPEHLNSLARSLATLAEQMNSDAAGILTFRAGLVLSRELENSQDADFGKLSTFGNTLAVLTPHMKPTVACKLDASGALVLAKAIRDIEGKDSDTLSNLGSTMANLVAHVPKATQTRLAALSYLFLRTGAGGYRHEGRFLNSEWDFIETVCGVTYSSRTLGGAQVAILRPVRPKSWFWRNWRRKHIGLSAAMRGSSSRKWTRSGISGLSRQTLDLPAKRPRIEDTIQELQALLASIRQTTVENVFLFFQSQSIEIARAFRHDPLVSGWAQRAAVTNHFKPASLVINSQFTIVC